VAAAIDHKLATDPDYELGPAPFTKFVSEIESAASKVQAATQAAAKVN
jgi:hypothetical protein